MTMTTVDLALFVMRIVLGVIFMIHGGQKLFGWMSGPKIAGTVGMMNNLKVAHPVPLAWMAALSEFVGGLLVLLGLFTPLGAVLTISVMVTAIATVHAKNGILNTKGGYEFNLSLITLAVAILLMGAGAFSLDSLLGIARPITELPFGIALILILIPFGGIVMTELSRNVKAHQPSNAESSTTVTNTR
jgi:putative oxidoreductase